MARNTSTIFWFASMNQCFTANHPGLMLKLAATINLETEDRRRQCPVTVLLDQESHFIVVTYFIMNKQSGILINKAHYINKYS